MPRPKCTMEKRDDELDDMERSALERLRDSVNAYKLQRLIDVFTRIAEKK